MILPIIVLILIIVFGIWTIFAFFEIAILALVNIVIGGIIVLRIIHDLKNKKNIMPYLLSIIISIILIASGYIMNLHSPFFKRFMLIELTLILALIFIIAKAIIWTKNNHN